MKQFFVRRLQRHRRTRFSWIVLIVILCIVSAMIAAFFRCRPVMTAFAESQAVWTATKIANQTVAQALLEYSELCSRAINVSYDGSEQVSAVHIDTASINTIRTAVTDQAISAMEQISTLSVSIPLGTLLGWNWISGFGPLLSFPVSFTPTILSDVTSSLSAEGINQSSYRVLLHLKIDLYVVSPAGRSATKTHVSYPMAEMVLLGEVPDNLTEVYGDDQSILGQIFDYGTSQ